VKVVKVRTKEGEICHFVKIIKMGGIKFKVEDNAIKMNLGERRRTWRARRRT